MQEDKSGTLRWSVFELSLASTLSSFQSGIWNLECCHVAFINLISEPPIDTHKMSTKTTRSSGWTSHHHVEHAIHFS
jgi:hypothetical protein